MAAPILSMSNPSSRATYSCIRCADRKVKCDRQRPCSACVRHNIDCVFHTSRPPRKRQKRVKVKLLIDRLHQYESLLQEHGIDPNQLPDTPNSEPRGGSSRIAAEYSKDIQTPSSIESQQNPSVTRVPIFQGPERFNFVENSLWRRVAEESHDADDILDNSRDTSSQGNSGDELSFVLGNQPRTQDSPRHPPPERIHELLAIFVDNVDPLTKVVHIPTLRPAIQTATTRLSTLPRSFEALMFSIYGAAIMSLKVDECRRRFSHPRKDLLAKYMVATEVALSRAQFMGTTSLVVLQALVLHLLSVRDVYEPRAVWTLTGVAVRIAQVMGLERDGSTLGLPPFETELRRRIWWQLKLHDFRTAELCGLAKFRDLDLGAKSTKWPTNINDDRLHPSMTSLEAESNVLTDTVFIALRCELANFAAARIARLRQQGKSSGQWNLDKLGVDENELERTITDLEEIIETKYLRYCDPSQPLHLLTMLVARYGMNVVRFLTHHPRRWARTPPTASERQLVWDTSIKLLEQHNMAQSNPVIKRFAWHATYFQQWHAFIHVLDTLRADPLKHDADRAWRLIGDIYENIPDMIFDMRKPIHVAVGNLCLKAHSDRVTALQNMGASLSPTPEFIARLREQREVARAKKRERSLNNSRPAEIVNFSSGSCPSPSSGIGVASVGPNTLSSSIHKNAMPSFQMNQLDAEHDPFSLVAGVEDSRFNNFDMELEFLLAQDYDMEHNGESTTWDQWDAWLGDSNIMRLQS